MSPPDKAAESQFTPAAAGQTVPLPGRSGLLCAQGSVPAPLGDSAHLRVPHLPLPPPLPVKKKKIKPFSTLQRDGRCNSTVSTAQGLVFAELKELLWQPGCCLQHVVSAGRRTGRRGAPRAAGLCRAVLCPQRARPSAGVFGTAPQPIAAPGCDPGRGTAVTAALGPGRRRFNTTKCAEISVRSCAGK